MMASQIRMTPDTMRTRAAQYGAEADRLGEIIRSMDGLLASLQSEWEGASSESYAQRYAELKPGFLKAEELIREIRQALMATANTLEQTDAMIASQFRA